MESFLGQIQAFGFNFAPRGWAFCDGQLLAISSNQALFSLLGTTYGGDGRTTFALPDLRGRSIVHVGTGPGLGNVRQGERGGVEQIFIQQSNLPASNASLQLGAGPGVAGTGGGNYLAANSLGETIYTSVGPANPPAELRGLTGGGSNLPIFARNPFLGINVSIALTGIFPSRS